MWISNNKDILDEISDSDRVAAFVDLSIQWLPAEKALSIRWDAGDAHEFRVAILSKSKTRGVLLSNVASPFDPSGRVAPIIFSIKILLRRLG